MSRTVRRTRSGLEYKDGRYPNYMNYICKCSYCTGEDKEKVAKKIRDRELRVDLSLI